MSAMSAEGADIIKADDRPVVNGRLVRSSVSQMTTFSPDLGGCPRKWWYRYVARLPQEDDSPAIKYGKECHKLLEDFWNSDRSGRVPDSVAKVVELFSRSAVCQAESPLTKLDLAGVPFKGSIDLTNGPYVYDYKFQNKIRKLDFGPQAIGYLEEIRRRHNHVVLGFTYVHVLSKEPFTAKFSDPLTLQASEVERKWQSYAPLIEDMKLTAGLQENEVWCNTGACFAYGRPCPYASVCNKGVKTAVLTKEINSMSFLNDLIAAKNERVPTSEPKNELVVSGPAEVRALPPDSPPTDIVPAPMPTPPSTRKKAKTTATRLKSIRLGLKVGMPEYSSVEASVEVEGTDEAAMAEEAKAALMRRLEALIPAYLEALEMRKGKNS